MPQGRALNLVKGKPPPPPTNPRLPIADSDERHSYLLKKAIIRKVEDDDKIIYAEMPGIPGVLVVCRKPSERNANPERLNLDRRELTQIPLLEGEERLRLLNLQHNFISKIENLLSLPNLIFLDLYNNQIREIAALHTVPTLRVLMLGKNQIDKIKNLQNLTKLDVLDLHNNKISKIENINQLTELRVLNLANNYISLVDNLEGLVSLTELNLRRNVIEQVKNLNKLPKLQRLFLSNNRLNNFEAVNCLSSCTQLIELALDGNPIHSLPNYMSWVISVCPNLTHLDLRKITPDIKEQHARVTPVEQPSTQASCPETESHPTTDEPDVPPENLITFIQQEWKLEIERLRVRVTQARGFNNGRRRKEAPSESLVQSGHAEIEGDSLLFIYGNALEILANSEFQGTVEQIFFQYVRFDLIVQHGCISKLKKFSKLKKLIFSDNNINSFLEFSKLECLPTLTSLSVENNDVCHTVLCRSFIVYRFPNITEINGIEVSDTDRSKARQQYQNFDKILYIPNQLVSSMQKPAIDPEDRDAQKNYRISSKKHYEYAQSFVGNIISHAITVENKIKILNERWADLVFDIVKQTARELSVPASINENTLRDFE